MKVRPTKKRIAYLKANLGFLAAVVVDFDGTLFQRQWLVELMLAVAKRFPNKRELVKPMRRALETYERHRTYDYSPVINEAVKIVPTFFVGLPQREVKKIARQLIRKFSGQTLLFSRTLVRHYSAVPLNKRGLLVAITGAPAELAEPFGELLGFDLVYGVNYEVVNGRYTGVRDEQSVVNKGWVFDTLVHHFNLRPNKCIGLGDTMSDVPLFERVGYAYAVNFNHELKLYARRHPKMIWVEDRQKSGVSFFRANDFGTFYEVPQSLVIPSFLGLPQFLGAL